MNKMIKLNKVTKEQVAEALRVLLEKQVEIANRPNKPYDPSENDLDKRNAAIANAWKIVKDDISYLPLHHQVISWAAKNNVNVPIRPNNEPLFKAASFN